MSVRSVRYTYERRDWDVITPKESGPAPAGIYSMPKAVTGEILEIYTGDDDLVCQAAIVIAA